MSQQIVRETIRSCGPLTGVTITRKGYRRGRFNGRLHLEHRFIWELANGPVPAGFCIHHIDHDKQNNALSNLVLVSTLEHKRLHSGCELRDGVWWKRCPRCDTIKPINAEHWYFKKGKWPAGFGCKPCHITRVVADKRRRRKAAALKSSQTFA